MCLCVCIDLSVFTSISGEKSGKINHFSGPEVQVQSIFSVFCMCSLCFVVFSYIFFLPSLLLSMLGWSKPCSRPVILESWEVYQTHDNDEGEELVELIPGEWFLGPTVHS
jgi:hypothetical protein